MANYQEFMQHADETALSLTRSPQNWTAFLTTAARLYKYSYNEQLMIYSQRPDATACAEFDIWNKRMGRYIKRGSKGIMLAGKTGTRYVFDVSDTGTRDKSRPFMLWEYSDKYENAVQKMFADKYDTKSSLLFNMVNDAVRKSADEYWTEHHRDITGIIANSLLEEYDSLNIKVKFIDAVTVSSAYSVLSRCGYEPETYYEPEDFLSIFDFNTLETISELGTAVGEINQQILRNIEISIKHYERAKLAERTENNGRTDLHTERRLFNPEPDLSGSESDLREVRGDAGGLSQETQSRTLEQNDTSRRTDTAPERDRQNGKRADRTDDAKTDGGSRSNRGAESSRPTRMGGLNEQLQSAGGGNYTPRTGVQLSLFPTEDEQIKIIDEAEDKLPFAFSVSDTDLENLLRVGSNTDNASMIIAAEFSKNKGLESNTEFLKSIYHGGYGIKGETDDFSTWYTADGIRINKGTTARYSKNAKIYSWTEIADKITDMLENGKFMSNTELDKTPGFEREQISEKLWFLYRDLSDEATEAGYLNLLKREKFLGFPDETAELADKMKSRGFQASIATQLKNLIDDYETDKTLIRFKYHKPQELLTQIEELSLPRTAYSSYNAELPDVISFITDDEIDMNLSVGSNVAGGRVRIYEFFTAEHTVSEKEEFLKNEYDIGGRSHALSGSTGSYQDYSGKDIRFRKDGCSEIQMSWHNVAKRITELVRADRYFTLEAKQKYETEKRRKQFDGLYGEYIAVKEEYPNDMVLFQVGDFFEMFGEDAKAAAEVLEIHIAQREIKDVGKVDFCGIPSFSLENNVEKLREIYNVTISAVDSDTDKRNVYTLSSNNNERDRDIDVQETEDEAEPSLPDVEISLAQYKPIVAAAITEDMAYRNACGHSDHENAVIEGNAAVRRAVLNTGDIELIRQYSDVTEFRHRLHREVIDETYPQLHELLRPISQDDIDNAVREWNGNPESKRRVNEYITEHGRERTASAWLANEYGGGNSLVVRAESPETMELSWTMVQKTLIKMVSEDRFLADSERTAEDEPLEFELYNKIMEERSEQPETIETAEQSQEPVTEVASVETSEPEDYSQYIGREIVVDDRRFEVDRINDLFQTVELRDITFQNGAGFPIFRSESLEWLKRVMELQEQSAEPIQSDAIPIDTIPISESSISVDPIPAEAPEIEVGNFRITDDNLGVGGAKAKFRANMDAINLLKTLEFEGRQATEDEQEILSKYVGWGSLPDAFDENKDAWSNEFTELYTALSPEEYKAAKASVLNAHYTSPTVIRAIYEAVENMGFVKGNILEPSMGVGNFFGMLPQSMSGSNLYGVELDSLTGRIAKQLYPKADITIAGFETTDRRDFYDLCIGNIPFGQYHVNDKAYNKLGFSIHDYFFAKAIDQVRPGGVIAFVTSRYTMDKQSPEVRKYIAKRAEFLGAIRLPNTAFKANAGTEVVSDIIFLQKRESPIEIEPDWSGRSADASLLDHASWIHLGQNADGFAINSYFIDNPDMVLGRQTSESTQYGRQDFTVVPYEGTTLEAQLKEAIKNIGGTYREMEVDEIDEPVDDTIPADPNVKNYSYTLIDDEVYFRRNSVMVKPDINATAVQRIKGMIKLRDCVNELIEKQMDADVSDSEIKTVQSRLNELYDSYVENYGIINSRANAIAFGDDSSYYLLCSLEKPDEDKQHAEKADMFTKRTIKPHKVVTSVDTSAEALAVSIGEKAQIDMEYMSQLTGKTEQEIFSELKGVIFLNPLYVGSDKEDKYLTADEYLSGNVREKLRIAQRSAEMNPDDYTVNVEALKNAQPKDLDASEIEVRLGATWIDKEYIREFMWETFDMPYYLRRNVELNYSPFTAEWNIKGKNSASYNDVNIYMTYGTERANAFKILEDTLNLRDVRIYDTVTDGDGKERRVLNSRETTLAQQKQQAVKDAFKDWIWKDADRREELVGRYNILFNSIRSREYDGRHITFSGMNPEITLREHQLNAVAHILYGGNTLLAHEVGAGKSATRS